MERTPSSTSSTWCPPTSPACSTSQPRRLVSREKIASQVLASHQEVCSSRTFSNNTTSLDRGHLFGSERVLHLGLGTPFPALHSRTIRRKAAQQLCAGAPIKQYLIFRSMYLAILMQCARSRTSSHRPLGDQELLRSPFDNSSDRDLRLTNISQLYQGIGTASRRHMGPQSPLVRSLTAVHGVD